MGAATQKRDPYRKQRHQALDRANEIRLARAELRRRIASGEIFAASVLLDVPDEARTMEVGELLIQQRRWGLKRTRRFLGRNQVAETKAIGQLTERQRQLLAQELANHLRRTPVGRRRSILAVLSAHGPLSPVAVAEVLGEHLDNVKCDLRHLLADGQVTAQGVTSTRTYDIARGPRERE